MDARMHGRRQNYIISTSLGDKKQVMEAFPRADLAKDLKDLSFEHDNLPLQRSLGLYWNLESDTYTFQVSTSKDSYSRRGEQYRSIPLCQTCLSQIHGLCRSDHPFSNISPILHCILTLLMSNSVIMKTRLFKSDFSFPKVNFPFVYHCLYQVSNFDFSPVTESQVRKCIKRLDSKKATGVNAIPPKIIKAAAPVISRHITSMANEM